MSSIRRTLSYNDWPELGWITPDKVHARHQAYLRRLKEEKSINDITPKQIAFDGARAERNFYLDSLNEAYVQP